MKKVLMAVFFCLLAVGMLHLDADREILKNQVVRLHVVGASDSEADQDIKLQVRDAVLDSLKETMQDVTNAEEAKAFLEENLAMIENTANRVLEEAGCGDTASVTLQTEEFGTRVYDTFTLPAGLYDALRITIGEGEGRNWWCVVFPSLCMPDTTQGFEAVAVGAGFSDDLTDTLTGEYEVRFLLLDLIGQMENFFHKE